MNLYIEPSARCSVECLDCHRYYFKTNILNPIINNPNLDFEENWLDNLFDRYVIDNLSLVKLTGLYGDPSEHTDLISFIKKIKSKLQSKSSDIVLHVETHGSSKDPVWWSNLARFINENFHKDSIIFFAIDGVNDKIHQTNRKNSSLARVIKNANAVIKTGLSTYCVSIEFEHTAAQIEKIEKNVLDFGFTKFKVRKPRNETILDTNAEEDFNNIRKSIQLTDEETDNIEIYCKWGQRHNYWVNFKGLIFRCPYHADAEGVLIPKSGRLTADNFFSQTNWNYYKKRYKTDELSLKNNSFTDIATNQFFSDLKESFTNHVDSSVNPKLKICAYYCGTNRQIS